jgi:endonuclease G
MTRQPRFLLGLLIGLVAGVSLTSGLAHPDLWAAGQPDAAAEHLKLGKPERKEQLLSRKGFVVLHDNQRKIPLWAAYHLTPDYLKNPRPRLPASAFAADRDLLEGGRAELSDYRKSGFDRGHMVPSADMRRADDVQKESFLLSNISPQNSNLNRHAWADLEEQVRDWVRESEEAYIYVGTVPSCTVKTIGNNRVLVPVCFFKIVARKLEGKWHAIGFVAENENQPGEARDWIMPIRDIELMTGFDFLSALPRDEQNALETRAPKNLNDW